LHVFGAISVSFLINLFVKYLGELFLKIKYEYTTDQELMGAAAC